MAPFKSIPRLELSVLFARLMHFARSALFRSSSVIAGRTPLLHSPGWVSHLPDGKPLSPIAFRLCNQSFLEFRGVMFRRTPIPRIACLTVSLPIYSRHAIWWSGSSWLDHLLESWSNSCPSVFLSNNAHSPRYVPCTVRLIGISRRVILCGQNCYELPLICTFLNGLRRSKNPQANTATYLLIEEIQNARCYSKPCNQPCFLMRSWL